MMILQSIEHELVMEREFRTQSPVAVALDPISFLRLRSELADKAGKTFDSVKGPLTITVSGCTMKVLRARITARDVNFLPFIAFLDEDHVA